MTLKRPHQQHHSSWARHVQSHGCLSQLAAALRGLTLPFPGWCGARGAFWAVFSTWQTQVLAGLPVGACACACACACTRAAPRWVGKLSVWLCWRGGAEPTAAVTLRVVEQRGLGDLSLPSPPLPRRLPSVTHCACSRLSRCHSPRPARAKLSVSS